MRFKDKWMDSLKFNDKNNPSFGIDKSGNGQGRIILSALVDDETRLLGFGIDVKLPNGVETRQCSFTVAIFDNSEMKIR